MRETDHVEDQCIDGRIILRWIFRDVECEGMGWIDVAQDRERWQALANVVMKLQVL